MPDEASPLAVDLIAGFEGFSSRPYQDSAGVWTIGYGSTRGLTGEPIYGHTPPITEATARLLLARDATAAAGAVRDDVRVPLGPEQVAALTSFVYNVGRGAFLTSTLLRLLNAGDYAGADAQFTEWDHVGGHVVHGLLVRRQQEATEFAQDGPAPVVPVSAATLPAVA